MLYNTIVWLFYEQDFSIVSRDGTRERFRLPAHVRRLKHDTNNFFKGPSQSKVQMGSFE